MERFVKVAEPACKKGYVTPSMKVEKVYARANLLGGSNGGGDNPPRIDVIIDE